MLPLLAHFANDWLAAAVRMVAAPDSRFFLPYLILTLLFALGVCRRRSDSWRAALAAVMKRDVFFHKSSRNDYVLAAINLALLTAAPAMGLLNLAGVAAGTSDLLRRGFGPGPNWTPEFAAPIIYAVVLFVVLDAGNFLQHWLQHKIPVLWELHKVHHSAEVMTPITSIRVHPLSALFGSQVLAAVSGLTAGVFLYLYGGQLAIYPVIGMTVLLALQYSVGAYHLQHSHIWLSFPPVLREILLSPATHMIHHSVEPEHYGRNFAFTLTVWDRLAGTLYLPDDSEQHGLTLGLCAEEQREMQAVWQLYITPLRRIAAMCMPWAREAPRSVR